MKSKLLKKLCAVLLSECMLFGAGTVKLIPAVSTDLSVVAAATTSDGNFQYEVNDDGGVTVTKYQGNDYEVIIPDTIDGKKVTCIGNRAFFNNYDIYSVIIPNSVKSIEEYAFHGCVKLASVNIPDSAEMIGDSAFYYCRSLTSVIITDGVSKIGESAFSNCEKLKTIYIPNSVKIIGNKAFSGCISLTSVDIPDSVVVIGDNAFSGCSGLVSVNIPENLSDIGSGAFYKCSGLADDNGFVIVKDVLYNYYGSNKYVKIPDGVKAIGSMVFYNCRGLTDITIPDSVRSIGTMAFYNCRELTDIRIPDSVIEIKSWAFAHCIGLSSISIPDSITKIEELTFSECSNLTSVTIPDSVIIIERAAFNLCKNLTINGEAGSYAETYAKGNGIRFQAVIFPLSNKSFISADSEILGNSVKVNFASTGGTGTKKYAVWYKKSTASSWTQAQDYKDNASASFTPKHTGKYDVSVKVKDGAGTIVKKVFTVTVNAVPLENNSNISADSVVLGQALKVTFDSAGGTGTKKYAVWYKKSTASSWTQAQDYKDNASVSFTPEHTGKYDVSVKVKDGAGTIVKKTFTVTVTASLANTSEVASATINLGDTINITCSAAGGSGLYQYAVYYKKSADTSWKTKQNYSSNTNVTIKPASKTEYDISVKVKDSSGKVSKKAFTVTVK